MQRQDLNAELCVQRLRSQQPGTGLCGSEMNSETPGESESEKTRYQGAARNPQRQEGLDKLYVHSTYVMVRLTLTFRMSFRL